MRSLLDRRGAEPCEEKQPGAEHRIQHMKLSWTLIYGRKVEKSPHIQTTKEDVTISLLLRNPKLILDGLSQAAIHKFRILSSVMHYMRNGMMT